MIVLNYVYLIFLKLIVLIQVQECNANVDISTLMFHETLQLYSGSLKMFHTLIFLIIYYFSVITVTNKSGL